MPRTIAYQGIPGSNSEAAAGRLAAAKGLTDVIYLPCVTSALVIESLVQRRADFGVVATRNSQAGEVRETAEALARYTIVTDASDVLPITHSLSVRSAGVPAASIDCVYSHPQALAQCKDNLTSVCPGARQLPMDDTALAAKSLAQGAYGPSAAVVCSPRAAELYGLHVLSANMQDSADNETAFALIHLGGTSLTAVAPPSDVALQRLATDKVISYVARGAIVGSIFAALYFRNLVKWTSFQEATAVGGVTTAFVLFLTSNRLQNWLRLRQLRGYWRYTVVPKYGIFPPTQHHLLQRAIVIDSGDEGIRIRGWWQGDGEAPRWQDTNILVGSPGRLRGHLAYWYSNVDGDPGEGFDGVTSVAWIRGRVGERVRRMSGWYLGTRNGDIGTIVFERIDQSEFNDICMRRRPPDAAAHPAASSTVPPLTQGGSPP